MRLISALLFVLRRFLHICESADDLVLQSQMQRELGRRTGGRGPLGGLGFGRAGRVQGLGFKVLESLQF